MRIITGISRGKNLKTLSGDMVRPTPERVKEAVFSAIQLDIEGRRILDLFAGSGQLGIEALSRGATSAIFIDSAQESVDTVKSNLKTAGFEKTSVIARGDYSSFLMHTKEVFDIAFLDPPYAAGLLLDALSKVVRVMSDYGIIICEHPNNISMPQDVGNFAISKVYRYGKIFITLYRKKSF